MIQDVPSTLCGLLPSCAVGKKVVGAGKVVTQTIEFTKDPLGYLASQMQKAVVSISSEVFPAFVKLLHPDLTVDWFLDAYKVSFAIGLILFGFLLLVDFLSYRKGQMGPSEFLDNLVFYVPTYVIGAMVGPGVGNFLCRVVGALCDGLIRWGGGSQGISGAGNDFTKLLSASTPGATLGGSIVTMLLMFVMMIAFILILVTLLFMFVTLYLSGAVFPVGWAWIVKGSHRATAFKIVNIWVGILMSQPLVFFMLALVMKMVSNNFFGLASGGAGASPLTRLMGLIGGILAMLMVAAGPFALNKLAPIGVGAVGAGQSLGGMSSWAGKGSGGGARGGAGESSDSDSQMGQSSRSSGGGGGGGEGAGGGGGAESAAGAEGAAAAGGPLAMAAMAAKEQSGEAGGGMGGDNIAEAATSQIDEASGEVSGQMDGAAAAGDNANGGGSGDGSDGSSLGDSSSEGGFSEQGSGSEADGSSMSNAANGGGSQDDESPGGSGLGDAAEQGGSDGQGSESRSGSGSGDGVSLAKASETTSVDSGSNSDSGSGSGSDSGSGSGGGGFEGSGGSSGGGGGGFADLASSMAQGASQAGSQIGQSVTEQSDHQQGGH